MADKKRDKYEIGRDIRNTAEKIAELQTEIFEMTVKTETSNFEIETLTEKQKALEIEFKNTILEELKNG
jgi:hypothetical protein